MSDAAIATLVTGVLSLATMVIGFLTLWIKLRYGVERTEALAQKTQTVEYKIDTNTALTRAGTEAATENAKVAATAANEASRKSDNIAEKLNGVLDDKIRAIVKEHTEPLMAMFRLHVEQDDKNMTEIRQALSNLRDRLHNPLR